MKSWRIDLRVIEIKPDGTEVTRWDGNNMTMKGVDKIVVQGQDQGGRPLANLAEIS